MSEDQPAGSANTRQGRGLAIVGSFTTAERKARGTGISVFRHTDTARWQHAGQLDGLVNPSYLYADPGRNLVYAAHGDADFASAYAIDPGIGRHSPRWRGELVGAQRRRDDHASVRQVSLRRELLQWQHHDLADRRRPAPH